MVTPGRAGLVSDTWVPVERRWLGIDKRTIPPVAISFVLIAILVGIIPAIDRAIEYDRQIAAGDVVDLGSGIQFVPVVGWGFPNGLLVSDDTVGGTEAVSHLGATLENGGVVFSVTTGPFEGTPDQLLDQTLVLNEAYKSIDNSRFSSDRVTATTNSGVVGVAQGFLGVNIEGVVATFVIDDVGVQIVVSGPPGTLTEQANSVGSMIDSLHMSSKGDDQ